MRISDWSSNVCSSDLLLIENGHTEGAQARWRTLHEVTITATLIADGGGALAERYFDHQAIEQKKALDDHNRATRAVGGSPLPQHQAAGKIGRASCRASVCQYV